MKIRLGVDSGLGARGDEVEVPKALGEALVASQRAEKVSANRSSTTADEATSKEGE